MKRYTHIIVDEIHERNSETDLLLLVLRKMIWNPDSSEVKLVLMSATIDADEYIEYFTKPASSFDPCFIPINIEIPLRHKKLDIFYAEHLRQLDSSNHLKKINELKRDEPELLSDAMDLAVKLINSLDLVDATGRRGAVLVFLPGMEEIEVREIILIKQL